MISRKPKLITIIGPTASGKTELAIHLAEKYQGEIVSADSRQIYRGMNIGMDKIRGEKVVVDGREALLARGIPHFLIDVVNPDEPYSLAQYQKDALAVIFEILQRGKSPFLAGGTGLYVAAVVDHYQIPQVPADPALRAIWEQQSATQLFLELQKEDLKTAGVIDPKNKRRLIRALEVVRHTGRSFQSERGRNESFFDVLSLGIERSREELAFRINARVEQQIKNGLVEETRGLLKKYDAGLPAFSGLGYRQIIPYIRGEMELSAAIERVKRDTRQYAKRQITWFQRDQRIVWIKSEEEAEEYVKFFLSKGG